MSGNVEYVIACYGIWILTVLVYVVRVKKLRYKYSKSNNENNL